VKNLFQNLPFKCNLQRYTVARRPQFQEWNAAEAGGGGGSGAPGNHRPSQLHVTLRSKATANGEPPPYAAAHAAAFLSPEPPSRPTDTVGGCTGAEFS
jgi:hypothetical protein